MNCIKILFVTMCIISSLHAAQEASPIFDAIKRGDLAFVRKYIEENGNMMVKKTAGNEFLTPLEFAIKNKQTSIIKEILINQKSRSQIDMHNAQNLKLLYWTISSYNDNKEGLEVAELLLNNGINVNQVTFTSFPLMQAAANGKINFVKLFLNTPNIDINSTNTDDSTALLETTKLYYGYIGNEEMESRMLECIHLLLNAGSNILLKDNKGESFFNHMGQDPAIKKIYNQFILSVNKLLTAAKDGDIKTAQSLLASMSSNVTNEAGITPLMRAAQNNNVEMIAFLLSQKANPNMTDASKMTALEWALYATPHTSKPVQKRTKQILDLLISAGARKTTGAYKTAVKFGYPKDIVDLLEVKE